MKEGIDVIALRMRYLVKSWGCTRKMDVPPTMGEAEDNDDEDSEND